ILSSRNGQPTIRSLDGQWYYRAYDTWFPLARYEGEPDIGSHPPYLLFGLGSPDRAEQLLSLGDNHRIYDPDPHRLGLFLDNHGKTARDKNWVFGTGLCFEDGFFDRGCELVGHPLLCDQLNPLPDVLSELTGSDQPVPENWVVVQTGALFFRDVLDVLRDNLDQDQAVFPVDTLLWEPEELGEMLEVLSPECLFSINLIDGMVDVSSKRGFPYVCWEIDPATSPYQPVKQSSECTRIYTYRRNNISLLNQAGYDEVEYCPLASNPDKRQSVRLDQISETERAPISFVGSSLQQNADRLFNSLRRWCQEQRKSNEDGDWAAFQRQLNRWVNEVPEWQEDTIDEIESTLIDLDIPLVSVVQGEPMRIAMAVAEYRAHWKRVDVVQTIGDAFNIHVWGDGGWEGNTGEQGIYCGEADHDEQLTRIYNGSKINLDINRIYQSDIITMRVYDVMATGSVVLTEDSSTLRDLFSPSLHCEVYENDNDLLDRIEELLTDQKKREFIEESAYRELRDNHTIQQRLSQMDLVPIHS
ncbi:MAG: glycosyltransferase, partial [bacterium]